MVGALTSAAAGMEAQQNWINALSNDIANSSTTGYKSLRVAFRDLAYEAPGRGGAAGTLVGAGSASEVIGEDFEQGSLENTGRPLDVAFTTPGFMKVSNPGGGFALSRAGDLQVGPQRELRTAEGRALLPPIRVPADIDPEKLSIAPDGTVSGQNAKGNQQVLGRIELVNVPNPSGLSPDGQGTWRASAASGAVTVDKGARLQQGCLEGSNVEVSNVMIGMEEAQQGYDLAGKAVTTQDEVLAVANGLIR
jgi:flagellar basal-body rod protein FlgG